MRTRLALLFLAVMLALGSVLAGVANADPGSDRLCVYAGYNPYIFHEECVEIPGYPSVPGVTGIPTI